MTPLDELDPIDFPLLLNRGKAQPGAVRRLVLGFRDHYESVVANSREEMLKGDLGGARKCIHSLHGVAEMLGAVRLADCTSRLEMLLREGNVSAVEDAIDAVEEAMLPLLNAAAKLERRQNGEPYPLDRREGQVPRFRGRACVLIVDDAWSMRELLQDVLQEEYRTVLAIDGDEGLRLAEQERPELILLDVELPDIGGYEVLARLKQQDATRGIPVMFVTGSSDIASETMGLSLGVVDYLIKPINPAILMARVTNQIRLRRAESEARSRSEREQYLEFVTEFEHSALLEETRQLQLKTKDDFLSHVSHELRAPAASIYAFVSLVVDGLAGEVNPTQVEYLGIAVKNVEHLQAMIEDLLQASRLGSGKLAIETSDVFIGEAVDYAVNTVSPSAQQKSIRMCTELGPALPSCICDQTRLQQTLTILLDNAVKFTPSGGVVSVAARIFEEDTSAMLIEVTDTGCGIAEDKVASVFDRLYQCADPKQYSRGLGLGLHIARELVERQGGRIWVDSVAGVGSTFRFTLPISGTGAGDAENLDLSAA